MGEALYARLLDDGRGVACRVYAPVGGHRDLLAYLVRRLLENGANSSFVSAAADPDVPVEELLRHPARNSRLARTMRGTPEIPAAADALRPVAPQFGRRRIRRPRRACRAARRCRARIARRKSRPHRCSAASRGWRAPSGGHAASTRKPSSARLPNSTRPAPERSWQAAQAGFAALVGNARRETRRHSGSRRRSPGGSGAAFSST